jgi:hypothetical protein
MALISFCGKACKCKRRCKGWFGQQPDLERQCKNACKTKEDLTREDFLCSGDWVDEQVVMGFYGYDPCSTSGPTLDDFTGQTKDDERNEEKLNRLMPVFLGLGLLIMGALFILYRTTK